MIEYFLLLLAIPLGFIAADMTRAEKEIYSKTPYFPIFLWILALLAAIFLTIDKTAGLTFAFMFILVSIWGKAK